MDHWLLVVLSMSPLPSLIFEVVPRLLPFKLLVDVVTKRI